MVREIDYYEENPDKIDVDVIRDLEKEYPRQIVKALVRRYHDYLEEQRIKDRRAVL